MSPEAVAAFLALAERLLPELLREFGSPEEATAQLVAAWNDGRQTRMKSRVNALTEARKRTDRIMRERRSRGH